MGLINSTSTTCLPRNELRASAYAPGSATASETTAVSRPTTTLCKAAPHHARSVKNCAYSAVENVRGGNCSSDDPLNEIGITTMLGTSRKMYPHHASTAPTALRTVCARVAGAGETDASPLLIRPPLRRGARASAERSGRPT